jgi:lipopolysaccharide cholinephosphotransferase
MELTPEQIAELRTRELEIYHEFSRVCDVLGLKYFLYAGTLLGAIRHNGFIPWDDDFDVCMPYADLMILEKKWNEIANKEYFLQTRDTDPEYILPWDKIRLTNSAFVETNSQNLHINHGIYIDVFPIVPCTKNKIVLRHDNLRMHFVYSRTYNYFYHEKKKPHFRSIVSWIFLLGRSSQSSGKLLWKRFAECQKKYQNTGFVSITGFTMTKFPSSIFDSAIDHKFDAITAKVPMNYDLFLRMHYGDYMTPPPLKERKSTHPVVFFSATEAHKVR